MYETASWKSSEASSSLGDERERAKIMQKIIEVKDKLRQLNDEREAEVVKFLHVTTTSEKNKGISENPQLIRIRNNFERRNKKHTQETEHLQRKLSEYEERLKQIDNGIYEVNLSKSAVISNGIKKASANVKGMTESVITAPIELAQRLKSAFGSADNINVSRDGGEGRLGQSIFFTNRKSHDEHESDLSEKKAKARASCTLPPNMSLNSSDVNHDDSIAQSSRPGSSNEGNTSNTFQTANNSLYFPNIAQLPTVAPSATSNEEYNTQVNEQLTNILQYVTALETKYDNLKRDVASELAFYSDALEEERFKITTLEKLLNDTIELHQAEFRSLKEQNIHANRVDFHHMDRFKNLEEHIESVENKIIRMDNFVADSLNDKLNNQVWGNAALSGANIVVEFLKIVLFVVASALDFIRPLTGSRNRAGLALFSLIILFAFGHHLSKLNPFAGRNSNSTQDL